MSRQNEWGAGLGASIKVRGVPREVPGQGGVMVRVRERSWKDWWKPGGIGMSKAGNYRREVQSYSQVSHEARSREEVEFTCLRAGVSGEHLQEVVMSKLRTEAAPESNREGAVWCMQRKQNTHKSKDKRAWDLSKELQVLVCVVGTKRIKICPGWGRTLKRAALVLNKNSTEEHYSDGKCAVRVWVVCCGY